MRVQIKSKLESSAKEVDQDTLKIACKKLEDSIERVKELSI